MKKGTDCFSGGSQGKDGPAMWETWFNPCVRKIPWKREWLPSLVFLPGESPGQRSLVVYSPWGRKESDTTEQLTHIWPIAWYLFLKFLFIFG